MTDSWKAYSAQFFRSLLSLELSLVEVTLLGALVLMMGTCVVNAHVGHDIGGVEKIQMAKLKAQEELMATRISE